MNFEGQITLDRRIASHPLWLDKPFSLGQAMVDLFLLANNRAVQAVVRGHPTISPCRCFFLFLEIFWDLSPSLCLYSPQNWPRKGRKMAVNGLWNGGGG